MSQSTEKFEVNGKLEHLFHKKDMESDDLMKFYNQEHDEVENEIEEFCETLPPGLEKDYFKEEDYYLAYKEAQTDIGSASINSIQSLRYNAEKKENL